MFKRILVPLDGSAHAERAVPLAARIARATGGHLLLLQVVKPPIEFVPALVQEPVISPEVVDTQQYMTKEYLSGIAQTSSLSALPVETIVEPGEAAETILAVAEQRKCDLIVMCSHGYSGLAHRLLGSVATRVAYNASIPVVVTREMGPDKEVPPGPVRTLVPLDGSERAELAILPAAYLVSALSAPDAGMLHLLRVVILPERGENQTGEQEAIIREAEQYLASAAQAAQQALAADAVQLKLVPTISWSITGDDDVAGGIVRVAESGEVPTSAIKGSSDRCHMIAIMHGYGGLQLGAFGSITERVLHATRLPMMITRATS